MKNIAEEEEIGCRRGVKKMLGRPLPPEWPQNPVMFRVEEDPCPNALYTILEEWKQLTFRIHPRFICVE